MARDANVDRIAGGETGGAVSLPALASRWMHHMRRGEFERAWTLSDAGVRMPRGAGHFEQPRHLQQIWDGRSLDGRRVLVRCYHGLGDTIQFARFLPALAARAGSVVVWAQPDLLPLLHSMSAPVEFLPLHDAAPGIDYDVDIEIMELAWALRVTPHTIPASVPYFHVDQTRGAGRHRLQVGVVWQAGEWDADRSVAVAHLAPLADLGVCAIALHPSPSPDDLATWRGEWFPRTDLFGLARFMATLDLVVSVDTMCAHLAGALAVPVWTMLKHEADWRWLNERDDSPWYPTMRLFRQPAPGDWASVAGAVARRLAAAAT